MIIVGRGESSKSLCGWFNIKWLCPSCNKTAAAAGKGRAKPPGGIFPLVPKAARAAQSDRMRRVQLLLLRLWLRDRTVRYVSMTDIPHARYQDEANGVIAFFYMIASSFDVMTEANENECVKRPGFSLPFEKRNWEQADVRWPDQLLRSSSRHASFDKTHAEQ